MSTYMPNDYVNQQREHIVQTYRDLHDLAEPSWKEEKTSRYLQERLQQADFSVHTFAGHYGLVAEIPGETTD
ncbi:MAG: amidohydrolase, partial [Brevibacillus sp.]|nr:amidohydrolase [Brevibacillus sp.]